MPKRKAVYWDTKFAIYKIIDELLGDPSKTAYTREEVRVLLIEAYTKGITA